MRAALIALALCAMIPSAFARSWHSQDWAAFGAALAPPPPPAVVYVPQPVYLVPQPQVVYVPVAAPVATFSWSYLMGGGRKGCSYSNGQQIIVDSSGICPPMLQ